MNKHFSAVGNVEGQPKKTVGISGALEVSEFLEPLCRKSWSAPLWRLCLSLLAGLILSGSDQLIIPCVYVLFSYK